MSNVKINGDLSIPDFFKGKSIFLTGGSGFIGRVLIEKLLRSCPDLENIFVLIRPKKNIDIEERIRTLTDVALFDKLRNENKNFLDKIIPVTGNIKELKLGISEKDRKRIIDNVSIVYNCAASVRFDNTLKDAVLTNVRSTREMMNLVQELKTIDAFVHISTLYANADKKVIQEKVYPRHDWQDAINLVESNEESLLEVFTQKYIHPLPNTYTFTKSLAELVVDHFCKNKIPAVIIRPSIVIGTGIDPFEGWIDNFNGPMGIIIAGATGIMKVLHSNKQSKQDYVFVDNVVKSIIVATWKKSIDFGNQEKDLMVCNVSTDIYLTLTDYETHQQYVFDNPPEKFLSTFSLVATKCWYNFYLRVLIQHILPALLVDVLIAVYGKNFRVMKVQRRLFIANMALLCFLMNDWESKNNNYLALGRAVVGINEKHFSFFHQGEKSKIGLMGFAFWGAVKQYLLKEKSMATKSEVRRYRMAQLAQNFLKYAFLGLILYIVTWRYNLPAKTYQIFYDYVSKLDS